jgi:hypothetical protein
MGIERFGGLRVLVANEAARLMYEEGIKQYFTAKRVAAKRLLGARGGLKLRYRPSDLPSNGEIRDALLELAERAEGDRRSQVLFAMRIVALEAMQKLAPFEPRLIGSVSTGHIRKGSDIDLHVYTNDEGALEQHMCGLGWTTVREVVTIRKGGEIREYVHHHIADVAPIELTVYPLRDLRYTPRSSTDGKPIDRVGARRLKELLVREHAEAWAAYLMDGTVEGMERLLEEEEEDNLMPTAGFQGWLVAPSSLLTDVEALADLNPDIFEEPLDEAEDDDEEGGDDAEDDEDEAVDDDEDSLD